MPDLNRDDLVGEFACTLRDAWNADDATVRCALDFDGYTLWIRPAGCGDASSLPDNGWPIKLEYYDGEVWLVVWGDINQEDATHRISLTGAMESSRRLANV